MVNQDKNNLSGCDQQPRPEFSVVITCHYEENSIEEFHSRLSGAIESLNQSYEIIFVNDGSTDKTFEKLKMIFDKDPHVTTIIDLFKNAGQTAAMTAGINHARGRKSAETAHTNSTADLHDGPGHRLYKTRY